MTRNQIAWQQAMEEQRANRAREEETKRHNEQTEQLGRDQLNEQIRYNTQWLGETTRHNKVMEQETKRHNLAFEANQRYSAQLQYSASMAAVAATRERNSLDYLVKRKQLDIEESKFDFQKSSWQKEYDLKSYLGEQDILIRKQANQFSLDRVDKQGRWNLGSTVVKGLFDTVNNFVSSSTNFGKSVLPFVLGG